VTAAGWLFLIFGWGVVLGVTIWCFYRIHTGPEE
jgi:hypothetical protein